ncbi:MAG: sulfatase-like hydrolase/transferase [Myxococcales bacterium]|nr:sulfatase-like hydrolase/transferase [Myxococcales bacterium]MCB9702801.1 sulfatase-like hydrolase/transferase [Myxococcales bacterium]
MLRLTGPRARAAALALTFPLVALPACNGDDSGTSWESDSGSSSESGGIDGLNVVIVVFESARARSTTLYDPDLGTTPFLVDLAAQGVMVEESHAVVTHTSKALMPVFCGIDPKIVKPIDEALPHGIPVPCLAELLDQKGYGTFFIQPARASWESRPEVVANMGFAEFASKETLPSEGFDESSYFGFEDDIMLGPALDWIDRQNAPFFLGVLTLTPHHDYGVPAGFPIQPFDDNDVYNRYLNCLAYTDRFIGKLHAGLAARGLLEDTLFIVVGDHGEGFGEHGVSGHDRVTYQEGLRVPLVLSGPGFGEAGTRITGIRQNSDILPTVARLLDVGIDDAAYTGRDLLGPAHTRIFASSWQEDYTLAMREGSLKALYHFGRKPNEVFDVDADPHETVNIIGEGDNQSFADDAIAAMLEWRSAINARYEAAAAAPPAPADGPAGARLVRE